MGLYDIISFLLSGTGYALLTYRSSFILSQNPDERLSLLQPLGMKWIVFIIFLILQPYLGAILEILPFGTLALLAIKCMIVMPENTLATYIYKRIQKQLQKMQFQQYNSKLSKYTSVVCKFLTIKFIRATKTLAIYVKSGELESIYLGLEDTLAALQYKRMTVEAKSELGKSKLQRQMSFSSGNDDSISNIDENDLEGTDTEVKPQKSKEDEEVFNRMSIINIGSPRNRKEIEYTVQAEIMTVKPNKAKGLKPKYESGTVVFKPTDKQIDFIYKESGKRHTGTLNQIKYVKVNMMVIELILENEPSIVIKFLQEQDVFPWVKPVMNCLNSN